FSSTGAAGRACGSESTLGGGAAGAGLGAGAGRAAGGESIVTGNFGDAHPLSTPTAEKIRIVGLTNWAIAAPGGRKGKENHRGVRRDDGGPGPRPPTHKRPRP